jgi:hypothetical protein
MDQGCFLSDHDNLGIYIYIYIYILKNTNNIAQFTAH